MCCLQQGRLRERRRQRSLDLRCSERSNGFSGIRAGDRKNLLTLEPAYAMPGKIIGQHVDAYQERGRGAPAGHFRVPVDSAGLLFIRQRFCIHGIHPTSNELTDVIPLRPLAGSCCGGVPAAFTALRLARIDYAPTCCAGIASWQARTSCPHPLAALRRASCKELAAVDCNAGRTPTSGWPAVSSAASPTLRA